MSLFKRIFGGFGKYSNNEEPEIIQDNNVQEERPNKIVHITIGTGYEIDAIYAFVKKDLFEDGYKDAMKNPDPSFKAKRIKIIKNELKNIFDQVNLKYRERLLKIETTIGNTEQEGMLMMASEYKSLKDLYEEHVEKLKKLEADFEKEEEAMMGMVYSYTMGFDKGFAERTSEIIHG